MRILILSAGDIYFRLTSLTSVLGLIVFVLPARELSLIKLGTVVTHTTDTPFPLELSFLLKFDLSESTDSIDIAFVTLPLNSTQLSIP